MFKFVYNNPVELLILKCTNICKSCWVCGRFRYIHFRITYSRQRFYYRQTLNIEWSIFITYPAPKTGTQPRM